MNAEGGLFKMIKRTSEKYINIWVKLYKVRKRCGATCNFYQAIYNLRDQGYHVFSLPQATATGAANTLENGQETKQQRNDG